MLNKTYTNVRNFSLILLTTIFVLVILKNLNIVNANSEILISENETAITSTGSSNSHAWKPVLPVNSTDFANIHYIDNAHYFIVNPLHNENVGNDNENGACTTVAMQLLMGYHNYYSDRRLIPVFNEDGDRYLSENYGNLAEHPKVNRIHNSGLGKESIGTKDLFFDKLMDLNSISNNLLIGQSLPLVANAARSFIENYSSEINDEVNINFYINDVISRAKSEIDAGRPTILAGALENIDINHNSHVVVAYGYANYQGEEGFIVHSGWEGYSANVWYPASWFGFQLTMSVDHEHDFVNDFDVYDNAYRKLKCSTCGCVDLDYIYDISSDGTTITGTNYTFYGEVTLPIKISGIIINSIGNQAFSNQINLTNITIYENITTIGDNAFDGCTSLSKVYINEKNNRSNINAIQIGDDVFNNCSSTLKIIITQRLYGAYINSNCWSEYIDCIEPNVMFDVINLNCKIGDTNFIMIENKKIIKLIVECNCYYKFINKSKGEVILYNESAVQITSNTMILIVPLEKGIYYLEPINGGTNLNDEFQVDFLINNYDIKEVTNNTLNNISSNIHLKSI